MSQFEIFVFEQIEKFNISGLSLVRLELTVPQTQDCVSLFLFNKLTKRNGSLWSSFLWTGRQFLL